MAEEENVEETDGEAVAGASKKKTIIIVAALLAVEAVALTGAFLIFAPEPKVAGAGIEELSGEELELEKIVEMEVLDEKLPNAKRGVTELYDTRLYVQVKQRNAERMTRELEQFSNEIKAEVSSIWRSSDPRVFNEPRLETLQRKLEALFRARVGTNPETGLPIVEKVVIVLGPGFRIDN